MIAASSDHRAPKASSETLFIVASRKPRGIWVLECLTGEDKKRHWPRIPTDMKTTSKQIHRFWGAEQGDSLDVFPCFSTTCFYWCIFYSRKETWKSNQYAHFPYIRCCFVSKPRPHHPQTLKKEMSNSMNILWSDLWQSANSPKAHWSIQLQDQRSAYKGTAISLCLSLLRAYKLSSGLGQQGVLSAAATTLSVAPERMPVT